MATFRYVDEGGYAVTHDKLLSCVWCGDDEYLFQRTRREDGAPYDVDEHGCICQQCIIDERVFHAQRRIDADYEQAAKAQQRISDAREGFAE